MRRFAVLGSVVLSMLALAAAPAFGQATSGEHSDNMEFVKNLPYELKNGGTDSFGTDIEFANIARPPVRARRVLPERHADRGHHEPARRADRVRLRLRRDPGRHPGVPAGRASRAARSSPTRPTPSATAPRPATGRPRRSGFEVKKSNGGPQRHLHRRDHRSASPHDGLVRRDHPGRAQPERPSERQLPLQLELGPDHVVPAGDRGVRHLELRGTDEGQRSSRCPRGRASAPSRTTSASRATARARTRRRSRRAS